MAERRQLPSSRVDLLGVDFTRDSLGSLRHAVRRCVEHAGLRDPALYRFVVAINEITTNAIQYGGGAGRLDLWREAGELRCRVTDRGAGLPARVREGISLPPVNSVSGRGLWLARSGCSRFDISTGPSGTSVMITRTLDS